MRETLTQQQIDAACRLHARLDQWRASDDAIIHLRTIVPTFDSTACLLKTVTINTLYSTRVFAVVRMGAHIERVMARTDPESAGLGLVDEIAALPADVGAKTRRHTSFASKFCRFFVNEDRFPIYDEAARNAIGLHIGRVGRGDSGASSYAGFVEKIDMVRRNFGILCTGRELDRYLWITGMYLKWLKEIDKSRPIMNREISALFTEPRGSVAEDLEQMLPCCLRMG
ncbi:MAG: hypothetical protein K8E66_06205 [Phycisphaerales bacterium]|nr:hypothetical protein [Phycisphaerales bacterium]